MATRAPPVIPPRPSRSPHALAPQDPDAPKIPPRPTRRRPDRSMSPNRDSFAPSPLNALPGDASKLSQKPPSRPPSVAALPSIGQEGLEYANIENGPGGDGGDQIQQPAETRNVNRDLYLHAPRPSLPGSTAKAQVEAVTRTDSRQAAAAGFGRPISSSNGEIMSPKDHGSQRDPSSERRRSAHLEERHGIPEIGQRVPMIPNAGDVQAPTPSHDMSKSEAVVSPRQGRHHARNRSARETSLPPGSYGLHGHGLQPNDKFEKAWYDKHPEELVREEQSQYGSGLGSPRPEWAMSSDDLNRIVKLTAKRAIGSGISSEMVGTPEEEIGYIATEELASRLASEQATGMSWQDSKDLPKAGELSPTKPSHAAITAQKAEQAAPVAIDEHDNEEVKIHIDEPIHHQHHPDGFMPAPEEHQPHGNEALENDDEGVLILAEDEVDERAEHLQPAVSPTFERKEAHHNIASPDEKGYTRSSSVSSNQIPARPISSPAFSRFASRGEEPEDMRPLEDVEEYEPLFPDDSQEKKIVPVEEQLKKRPEYHTHRFPSRDIWEDAPDSLQLQTTVSVSDNQKDEKSPIEIPAEEMARNRHAAQRKSESSSSTTSNQPSRASARAAAKQRFPSRDIWEEVPESQRLETTVAIPEQEDEPLSPETREKPTPQLPARPSQAASSISPTESRKPTLPDRPKPQIPPRPARPPKRTSEESLTKVTSNSSNDSGPPLITKPKPPVPSRPVGSKIAALKAGFLSDLDNRLKIGPQPPKLPERKEAEPESSKGPLADARKGRARGPTRRKPAASSIPEDTVKSEPTSPPQITLVEPWDVWSMGHDGVLVLGQDRKSDAIAAKTEPFAAKPIEPPITGKAKEPEIKETSGSTNETGSRTDVDIPKSEPPKGQPEVPSHRPAPRSIKELSTSDMPEGLPSDKPSFTAAGVDPEAPDTGNAPSKGVSEYVGRSGNNKDAADHPPDDV